MRITRSLAALAVPLALVAAGCADEDKADSSATTAAASDSSGASTTTAATAADPAADDNPADANSESIVEIAQGHGAFSILVDLVVKAGLAEALSGEGPFTVFAPTNAAFGHVPSDTLGALAADPTGALADVLKLHVVAGKVTTADIPDGGSMSLDTLNGGKLLFEKRDGAVYIGGQKVIAPDIVATNGIVHAIDGVITAPNG